MELSNFLLLELGKQLLWVLSASSYVGLLSCFGYFDPLYSLNFKTGSWNQGVTKLCKPNHVKNQNNLKSRREKLLSFPSPAEIFRAVYSSENSNKGTALSFRN